MPSSYWIDAERRLVFNRIWGEFSDGLLIRHAAAIRTDPRVDRGYSQLADLREVARFSLTPDAIRTNADLTPYGPDSRRAIVVANESEYGLARLFQLSLGASGDHVLVSRELAAALTWLGLAPDTRWPEQVDRVVD